MAYEAWPSYTRYMELLILHNRICQRSNNIFNQMEKINNIGIINIKNVIIII